MPIQQELSELLNAGEYETFKPKKSMTINDLLEELGVQGKYFGVLVNGKNAEPETRISPSDDICILPHIAGG